MNIVIITENPTIKVITSEEATVVLVREDDPDCVVYAEPTVDKEQAQEYVDLA